MPAVFAADATKKRRAATGAGARLAGGAGMLYKGRMFSPARELFSYRPFWAKRFGTAPVLPRTRAEMDALGWDACDVVLVTGDAYIDHPAFGMALVGRLLEAQGFRVGILSQPDWDSAEPFREFGEPALFFGVTAGNMDSLVNQFTSDKKPRSDDAYTPDAAPNRRPSRASIVYAQRCACGCGFAL